MTVPDEDVNHDGDGVVRDPVQRLALQVGRLELGQRLAALLRRCQRPVAGLAWVALALWMSRLFFVTITITVSPVDATRDVPLTIQCAALASVFEGPEQLATLPGDTWSGDWEGAGDSTASLNPRDVEAACDRRRVASSALIAFLTPPTTILAMLALLRRQRPAAVGWTTVYRLAQLSRTRHVAFVGENGFGKATLAAILAALRTADTKAGYTD